MPLPDISVSFVKTHTISFGDDLIVTFRLQLIAGNRFSEILEDGRDETTGKTPHENIAVTVLTEGIATVSSNVEANPVPFTAADAEEVWTTWPEWARWELYAATNAFSTKGPAANPSSLSAGNEPDA